MRNSVVLGLTFSTISLKGSVSCLSIMIFSSIPLPIEVSVDLINPFLIKSVIILLTTPTSSLSVSAITSGVILLSLLIKSRILDCNCVTSANNSTS